MKNLSPFFRLKSVLLPVSLFLYATIFAQELSREQLEEESIKNFNNHKYQAAKDGFEKLLEVYPREPGYNYYLGVCYLKCNTSLEKSVQCLRFAASRNYKANAHYYLSLAYFRNYRFDDAEIALVNFINLAPKKDLLKLKPELLQASIAKVREETYMTPKIRVLSNETLIMPQLGNVYALHIKGRVIPKTPNFMIRSDIEKNYQGIMYIPAHSEAGYTYYLPVVGKSGRTGKDIFASKQVSAIDFTIPEAVAGINTKYDEEFPYFDSKNKVLYFSSNRLGGIGGYDIYKSCFDTLTNRFKEPERLGFPINSPFDDLMYIPDSTGQTALFVSDRNTVSGKLTAYKIEQTNAPEFVFPQSQYEYQQLASLEIEINPNQAPVIIENLSPSKPAFVRSEYDIVLQQALGKQLICDSLRAMLISQKNKLRVEQDMDQRRILLSAINAAEQQTKSCQSEADNLFARAEQLQADSYTNGELAATDPSSIGEVTQLKVYAFQTGSYLNDVQTDMNENTNKSKENPNIFEILEKSPYSEKTPIPYDVEIPAGLVYRIQLGAFAQGLPMNTFGGLTPISAEKIPDRNLVKYYVGYFTSSKDARKALDKVKNYGFIDAFLVPYFGKEKISIQSAREIEFGSNN